MAEPNADAYYRIFAHRQPVQPLPMTGIERVIWQCLAGVSLGLGVWYLMWRWGFSLNPDAIYFSVVIAGAETLMIMGTALFFFDIWEEPKTREIQTPRPFRAGGNRVALLITTYDEDVDLVSETITAAKSVRVPDGWQAEIFLLDDGNRKGMRQLAQSHQVRWIGRETNLGFKAGNLKNALLQIDCDFFAIADADTLFLPSFLDHTLGYFHDPNVAWVQTPHWFYDLSDGTTSRWKLPFLRLLRWGRDPFLADPSYFFDVIQRRRDRHGASFCCGAGSIHRTKTVFDKAIDDGLSARIAAKALPLQLRATPLQPFRFHVSEDIFTSIDLHQRGWTSVYHPRIEARMLSPWSMEAWAAQKLKYAGGTFDIFMHHCPLLNRGLSWPARLHYFATFWSYLSVLWIAVLLIAPCITLLTGIAPVSAYSFDFFYHLLPVLVVTELAFIAGSKGYDTQSGRLLTIASLPITARAFWLALRGRKLGFKTTPKSAGSNRVDLQYAWPHLVFFALFTAAATTGILGTALGWEGYNLGLLVVNLFWLAWNALGVLAVLRLALRPPVPSPDHIDDTTLETIHAG